MPLWRVDGRAVTLAALLTLAATIAEAEKGLDPIAMTSVGIDRPRDVQLAVSINGIDLHLVEPFTFFPDGHRLSIQREALQRIGVRVPSGEGPIFLDQIATIRFRYDDAHQSIDFTLTDAQRLPRIYDARSDEPRLAPTSDIGLLTNYSLFAASAKEQKSWSFSFGGANASVDSHLFSPVGVVSQSGIVGATTLSNAAGIRLDTDYTLSDPGRALTYQAGDTISGGLGWTRPIRMGGLQVQRDFALRSDLVTVPLPQISGTAAVPSTVDVFVNGTKTYSQDVSPGPYSLTDLPLIAQNGTAQVLVRDATGREVETSLDLFSANRLLAPGLTDFSAEAGFARLDYGALSDSYDGRPVGSASARHGFSDWLTGEVHAELGAGLAGAGGGSVTRFGPYGSLSTAVSGSYTAHSSGLQLYGSYELQAKWFSLQLGSQRTFGAYDDLASVTGRTGNAASATGSSGAAVAGALGLSSSLTLRPPKLLDRASIGVPLPFDKTNLSLGFVDLRPASGAVSHIATAAISRNLPYNATLTVTAFNDFADQQSRGLFIGLSVPLSDSITVTTGVSESDGALYATASAQKTQPHEEGTYGWRLDDREGNDPVREVESSYRSGFGQLGASVQQIGSSVNAQASIDGSIAVMRDGVVAGNRTSDSFAVVDTGVSGVPVLQDNRPVGVTDMFGKYLVPDLRSYERNRIAIDPANLPASADIAQTDAVVAPPGRSGTVLSFGVKADAPAAVVAFKTPDGKPLQAGLKGRLEGGDAFIVGYDGRAYIKDLGPTNTAVVDTGSAECRATFDFAPTHGRQTLIDGVVCQ